MPVSACFKALCAKPLTQHSHYPLTTEDVSHVLWDVVGASLQGYQFAGGVTKDTVYHWATTALASVPTETLADASKQDFLIQIFR